MKKMVTKTTLLLMLLSCIIQSCISLDSKEVKQLRYTNTISPDLSNIIETNKNGSIQGGQFYGVEFHEDGTPIYYLSNLEDVMTDKESLSFVLRKYQLSYDRWEDLHSNKPFAPRAPVSGLILTTQYFTGEIHGDSLLLQRAFDFYDSRIDELIFVLDEK